MRIVLLFLFLFSSAGKGQILGEPKMLSKEQYESFTTYLKSKNLEVKDKIIIKYDFNNESCWTVLDEMDEDYIKKVVKGFQDQRAEFNSNNSDASAYNFRQPGNNFNLVKKWDPEIIIDDNLFIKNLFLLKKVMCGCSIYVDKDRSYVVASSDPHFYLLNIVSGARDKF